MKNLSLTAPFPLYIHTHIFTLSHLSTETVRASYAKEPLKKEKREKDNPPHFGF